MATDNLQSNPARENSDVLMEEVKRALSEATLPLLYLDTLHRAIEHSFEELRSFIDIAETVAPGSKERLRGEISHGLNLVYMAHDPASIAKRHTDEAEKALYTQNAA